MKSSATTSVATDVPSARDLARVEEFTREPMVLNHDDPAVALAPRTARRRAFDGALAELERGAERPSPEWCRQWSLLLGLQRLLIDDEPVLADGKTTLNAHQVDALSGTLTALTAETEVELAAPPGEAGDLVGDSDLAFDVEPDDLDDEEEDAIADLEDDAPDWDDVFDDEEHDEDEEDDDEADPSAAAPDDGADDQLDAPLDGADTEYDADQLPEQPEDPNASRRFWFEHATGAGKTVAAMGFVDASRTGGILILTHRRNLVDQFVDELVRRGYRKRISPALLGRDAAPANGPVTVETYQWFVRHAGNISDAYSIVICDEAHTALGEKTSAAIRKWSGPVFIGMTATGALIARHVTDLFPTQTSRFDLAQAARRGVIAPLRAVRIPPGPGVRTIANVPLRKGEVDQDFDQEQLAAVLDQTPFNAAIADLYQARFRDMAGVVYTAGVQHAHNVAAAFRDAGIKARAVSGETPKRELAETLAAYERGEIDVLANAQLLAEGWNSPRATVCMHLAPTASKRIYQQRVGRVTRRHPGKEAGIVVDFVHPGTPHDDPVVTLHSLLDRDVYRGGAIVVGPIRRGRGRKLRVDRRVLPLTPDPDRRATLFERELWRIAVAHLEWGEQHVWAALAGSKVNATGWRRARAMIQHDRTGELRRRLLLTAMQRNRHRAVRLRAVQDVITSKDVEAFDLAVDIIGGWQRDERREAAKLLMKAIADRPMGTTEQVSSWIWRLAEYTREVHEQYAAQRWPETKRLLGLLVNSSGAAHGRNARRIVNEIRSHDLRLTAAILAASVAHSPEAEDVLRGARTRLAGKPSALARELGRNFPKRDGRRGRRRKGTPVRGSAGRKARGSATPSDPAELLETVKTDEAAAARSSGNGAAKQAPGRKRKGGAAAKSAAGANGSSSKSDTPSTGDVSAKSDAQLPEERAKIPVLGSFEELSRSGDSGADMERPAKEHAAKAKARRAAEADAASQALPRSSAEAVAEPEPRPPGAIEPDADK